MTKLTSRLPERLRPLLRFGPGILIIAVMAVVYDPTKVQQRFEEVNWTIALPALLGLVLVHLLQVQSWRLLARYLTNLEMPWRFAARAYYAGQAFGSLTPGNVGADVYRAYAVDRTQTGWRGALVPIISQRLLSYLGLILLAMAAVAATYAYGWLIAIGALVCVAAASFVAKARGRLRIPGRPLERLTSAFLRITALETMPRLDQFLPSLVFALCFHALSILLTYFLVLSVAGDVSIVDAIGVLTLARLATMLPFVPYGLGLQEGAFVLVLPGIGVSAEAAIAASLLSRVALLGTIVVGVAAWLTTRRERQPEAAERIENAPATYTEAA